MLAAAAAVASFLEGYSHDAFLADAKTRSAVLQQLTVIGEAAARLTPAFRDRYPAIDWVSIVGFRNRAIHAYFTIDWSIVWDTAIENVPSLAEQLTAIVREETTTAQSDG